MEELEQVKNKMNECQFIIDLHNEINQIEVDIKKVTLTCDIAEIWDYNDEENQANALLISKAPEMLEMLVKTKDYLETLQDIYGNKSHMNQRILKIKELIKQVT